MIKLKIISIGKIKEAWLADALNEYIKRLKPIATIEYLWAKDDEQLLQYADREPLIICLDPVGEQMTSEQFSAFMQRQLEQGGARLAMIIGGCDGLPKSLKQSAKLISLSALTFTHQLTHLVLLEQIYRAFEIAKGTKYHK